MTGRGGCPQIAGRTRSLSSGGIGALHALARQIGLSDASDRQLPLLKFHFPYDESDHVLTFAYNALCDGTCLQDLELRRQDEVFRDALGAKTGAMMEVYPPAAPTGRRDDEKSGRRGCVRPWWGVLKG